MLVKAVRVYVDKNTMQDVNPGDQFEVTEERFAELTQGPKGVFVILAEESTEEDEDASEENKATSEESSKSTPEKATESTPKEAPKSKPNRSSGRKEK